LPSPPTDGEKFPVMEDDLKHIGDFYKLKENKQPIAMLTAYDFFSGTIAEMSEIDIILVGDSLGNVIQGKDSTLQVTLQQMIYHAQCVRVGAPDTFMVVDMPYMTFHLNLTKTKKNAAKIMVQTGANAVKIEGGSDNRLDVIRELRDCQIPVVAHLGLTPQSKNIFGSFKVQATTDEAQNFLMMQARYLQEAGAFMLVLECVPEDLGKQVSESLNIPVIGIGAGRYTDGQVLVWHDMLGMTDAPPKFVRRFADMKALCLESVSKYKNDVQQRDFPAKDNVYYPV